MKTIFRMTVLVLILMAIGCPILYAQSPQTIVYNVTIEANSSISKAVDFTPIGSCTIVRITVPTAWTAADLTFKLSTAGVTYGNYRDIYKGEITAQVNAAGDVISMNGSDFLGIKYLQIRSGTAATPVTQTSERVLKVECKQY